MANVLDGNGVSSHFFHALAKQNRQLECARVFIPTTILFDNGFASGWFASNQSEMEVKRISSKTVPMSDVFHALADGCQPDDICASFVVLSNHLREAAALSAPSTSSPLLTHVDANAIITDYFTVGELHDFLFSPIQKPRGVLQKFEQPKGLWNTTIRATWTPAVTLAESVRSKNSLHDHSKSSGERCMTFESRESKPVALTNSVTSALQTICQSIASHLHQVEHVNVASMVLHFKVTRTNRVVLLYSTSIRCSASNSSLGGQEVGPVAFDQPIVSLEEQRRFALLAAHLADFAEKRQNRNLPRTLPRQDVKTPSHVSMDDVYSAKVRLLQSVLVSTTAVGSIKKLSPLGRWSSTGASIVPFASLTAKGHPVLPVPTSEPLKSADPMEAKPAARSSTVPATDGANDGENCAPIPVATGAHIVRKAYPVRPPRQKPMQDDNSQTAMMLQDILEDLEARVAVGCRVAMDASSKVLRMRTYELNKPPGTLPEDEFVLVVAVHPDFDVDRLLKCFDAFSPSVVVSDSSREKDADNLPTEETERYPADVVWPIGASISEAAAHGVNLHLFVRGRQDVAAQLGSAQQRLRRLLVENVVQY